MPVSTERGVLLDVEVPPPAAATAATTIHGILIFILAVSLDKELGRSRRGGWSLNTAVEVLLT